jgi:ankyrin repeat protein
LSVAALLSFQVWGQEGDLQKAAFAGDLVKMKSLITAGADVSQKNKDGNEPIHYAAMGGKCDVINFLLALGAKIDATNKNGTQPIHYAAEYGGEEVLKLLLEKGASIEAKTQNGWEPIHFSVKGNKIDMINLLLALGAKVDATGNDGMQPIHIAANQNKMEDIKLLVKHGAKKYARDYDGWNALHHAAFSGDIDIMEYLVPKKSNYRNDDDQDFLVVSCSNWAKHQIKLGTPNAQKYIKSRDPGLQAIGHEMESEGGYLRYLKMDQKEKKLYTSSYSSYLYERYVEASKIKERRNQARKFAPVPGVYDWEPIQVAAFAGKNQAIVFLLQHGAEVNDCDDLGFQPIHAAAMGGQLETVKFLLLHGARADAKANDGSTPYSIAQKEKKANVAAFLLDRLAEEANAPQNAGRR